MSLYLVLPVCLSFLLPILVSMSSVPVFFLTVTAHILMLNASIPDVGAFHGILPHVANIDNRSAMVLICKCSLLCNNIPIATHTRNSTAPSLLWYGLVSSTQQRTAFSNDPTEVLYWVCLKTLTELYVPHSIQPVYQWYPANYRCKSSSLCGWHLSIWNRTQGGLRFEKSPAWPKSHVGLVWTLEY
jgi:hypothetical protein